MKLLSRWTCRIHSKNSVLKSQVSLNQVRDAIRAVEQLSPDLVLMDILLKGDMDGIEVASKIRETSDIPYIYITASTDMETLNRAKETYSYGYNHQALSGYRSLHGNRDRAV